MDSFISAILAVLREHGSRAVRVFPPAANVLLSLAERIASEVVSEFLPYSSKYSRWCQVGEYIASLVTRTREISNALFGRGQDDMKRLAS